MVSAEMKATWLCSSLYIDGRVQIPLSIMRTGKRKEDGYRPGTMHVLTNQASRELESIQSMATHPIAFSLPSDGLEEG
ncbi:hypothetical protein BPOR_0306g00080 [Botrytis porri]|uniref:Uncharacterized protein n=1 Tax=Botrytis porri TaxID=87229 RepID=A0A4Z1KLN8_9HELO|nr:hypothetical protein BPOR_0306g00080 [Botrytis porri]